MRVTGDERDRAVIQTGGGRLSLIPLPDRWIGAADPPCANMCERSRMVRVFLIRSDPSQSDECWSDPV